MRRLALMFAFALATVVSASFVVSAAVDNAKFEREFKAAKTPLLRSKVVEQLTANTDHLKSYELVLSDPYWNVRFPVVRQIAQLSSADDRKRVAEYMVGIKDEKVRHQMVWAYGHSNLIKPEEWEPLHKLLHNDKESEAIKATVLRAMTRWPARRPPVAGVNASEADTKRMEEEAKAIHDVVQPILKANFKAYMELLKFMQTDSKFSKRLDPKKKDNPARLMLWLTVFGLEKLTSEEGGDSYNYWDLHLQKLEKDNLPFTYRWDDDREQMKIGDVDTSARTTVRKKPRKESGVHLMFMPDDHSDLYFAPYDREFSQDFKISSFIKPDGSKWGRKHESGRAYFYPDAKVAEVFREHRRAQQGGMYGMLCIGSAAYLAMEYAKSDPDGCAFIVCVGAWSSNNVRKQGRGAAENDKREDIKNHYRSLYTNQQGNPHPPEIWQNDENNFHREAGTLSHRFSDPHNPDIYYLQMMLQQAPRREGSGLQSLLDEAYEFKARGIDVPALFIFGEHDRASAQRKAQSDLSKMFTNAKFVTMKGTSLLPWLEDPIGFMDEFEAFMKEKKVWERIEKFKAKEAADKKK